MGDGSERKAGQVAHFELNFSPNVHLVSTVRRFVTSFYEKILDSAEVTSQLAVATHELLDNAVTYSFDSNTSIRIDVRVEPEGTDVLIRTRNRASQERISKLRAALDDLCAAPDVQAHYQKVMRASAKRSDGSGLGLARVRAESDMVVSYEIEGDLVQLRAAARFKMGERT
jgi:hypothetical protein